MQVSFDNLMRALYTLTVDQITKITNRFPINLLSIMYHCQQNKWYPQKCQIVRKMLLTGALCNEISQQ